MITEDEQWLPISQAAVLLGVSERTVRNYINGDKIPVHKDRGRTYVDVSAMRQTQESLGTKPHSAGQRPDESPADESQENALTKIIGAELALRGQAQEMITRADREVEHLRVDLKTARRSGRAGWAIAVILLIAIGAGAAWGMGLFTRLDQQLEHARIAVVDIEADLERREQNIAKLEGRIDDLTASLGTERAKLNARIESEALAKAARAKAEAETAARIETLTTSIANLERTLGTIREKNATLEQDLKDERTRLVLAVESRVKLHKEHFDDQLQSRSKILEMESEVTRADQHIKTLEGSLARLKTEYAELQNARSESRTETRGNHRQPTSSASASADQSLSPPAVPNRKAVKTGPRAPKAEKPQPTTDAVATAARKTAAGNTPTTQPADQPEFVGPPEPTSQPVPRDDKTSATTQPQTADAKAASPAGAGDPHP